MPNRRFDWHEHIKNVESEYHAARVAVDRLKAQLAAAPDILSSPAIDAISFRNGPNW